jgi:heme oxygenase
LAPALTLTAEMRRATRSAHHAANAIILAKLAVALNDRHTYGRALASFHPVYNALEALLEQHRSHAVLGPVAEAALLLRRTRAMEEDLDFLLGGGGNGGGEKGAGDGNSKGKGQPAAGWRWAAAASSSAAEYAAHLQALADEDPALLLPYAWSLYVPVTLGFMGARVARGLGVAAAPSSPLPSAGVRFFDLRATAGIADASAALARLRAAVDGAGASMPAELRARLCFEAKEQFRRNNAVVLEFPLGARDVLRTVASSSRVLAAVAAVVVVAVAVAVAVGWGRRW